jgi:hypothetical protein
MAFAPSGPQIVLLFSLIFRQDAGSTLMRSLFAATPRRLKKSINPRVPTPDRSVLTTARLDCTDCY